MQNKLLLTICKIAFSAALLAVIITKADPKSLVAALQSVRLEFYVLAVLIYVLSLPLRTLRWGIFLKEKNVTIPQPKLLLLYCIGMFFNTFLPTMFGGDAVRIYYIYREYHTRDVPATSVIVERCCGVAALFCIGLASSLYWIIRFGISPFVQLSLSACLAGLICLLLLVSRRLHKVAQKLFSALPFTPRSFDSLYRSFQGYSENKRALLAGLGLSAITSLATIIIAFCLSRSLGWQLPFSVFLYTIPVITITTMIPVSFGGIGVRETAFLLVFSQFGIAAPQAVSLALLWYSINLIFGIFGGI
ncbi:lysylphosphatidylglycerol synthase transmembrane domain-containing protein, partial [Thermodesulfobacteriota bacterium]